MGTSPARKIAFDVLLRVETEAAFAADLLHARLGGRVKREDAALATELTLGVLRWQRLLDAFVARHLKQPTDKLDAAVRIALRLGAYQLRFLERVPAHAAVNESVKLVKRAGVRSAASLVNAVLRHLAAEAKQPPEALLPGELPASERLALLHSHPTWLVERWLAAFGQERTLALLEANNRAAPLACAVHDLVHTEEIISELRLAGCEAAAGRWLASALIVRGGSPAHTKAFRRGWISIQDEASQMVPLLAGTERGDAVLDLCAAPGGKTLPLARAAGEGALVVAADLHLHRLRAMREHLNRVGVAGVALVALDASAPLPWTLRFRRILVDAPCSGTGTLARNPEIRWRLKPADLAGLQSRQVALLRNALEALDSGGRLIYSTCSLEPEENEQVVRQALAGQTEFRITGKEQLRAALVPHLQPGVAAELLCTDDCLLAGGAGTDGLHGGVFRTFPPEHGTDGFFAVGIERLPGR